MARNKASNSYTFIDGNLPNTTKTLYYRIESVDYDGAKEYSVIRNVELGIRNTELKMYPNPTNGIVHIECSGAKQ